MAIIHEKAQEETTELGAKRLSGDPKVHRYKGQKTEPQDRTGKEDTETENIRGENLQALRQTAHSWLQLFAVQFARVLSLTG